MIADDCSVALDHLDMSQASEPTQQADSPSRPVTSRRSGTSPAERQRQKRARDRQQLVYETPDWQLFIDSATLPQKAGCPPHRIREIVLKELVDNALDAGANVTLDWDEDTWVVSDDGPGIDPADVPKLYAVNRPLLSSKLRRLPLRGMLGNGLRVVVGAIVAYGGSLVVETRGRRLTLSICSTTGATTVATDEPVPSVPGTVVRLVGRGWGSPEIASLARGSIALAQDGKPCTTGVSSPWWYGAKDLHRLFTSVTPEETTVGRVCNSLGLKYDDERIARSLTPSETATVLKELRHKYEPVRPEALGFLGEDANLTRGGHECLAYAWKGGIHTNQAGAVIPYAIEAWAGCHRSSQRGQGSVGITVALNRSITVSALRGNSEPDGIRLDGCSLGRKVYGPAIGHYSIVLSIITPHVQLSGDGKEPVLTPYSEAIVEVVGKACRAAYRRMERPEHGTSIKDAAWQVMEQAYDKASTGRTLPANARQIMYAARGDILRLTGKDKLSDVYFTQTLLPDYVAEHKLEEGWDVVYDARGSLIEPHTEREIRLGTIEVRDYLDARPPLDPVIKVGGNTRSYPTMGPENRYRNVLYIEKEGFAPLLSAARIAERFDIAIMSNKGLSVVAARTLLDRLAQRIDKLLVMHDFDVSGFTIFGTLRADGRRYKFLNKLPIFDIGLRLADVDDMHLESEPAETTGDWQKRARTLQRHGATDEEIAFLRKDRVELNAMTSGTFVSFLERKLTEHGVEKVVPDGATMKHHARRVVEQRLIEDLLTKVQDEVREQAAKIELPVDLDEQVRELLQRNPAMAWDEAVAAISTTGSPAMSWPSNYPRAKLAKVLPLLGSDKQGERDAAALATTRILANTGLSWSQILAVEIDPHREPLIGWRQTCAALLQRQGSLRTWERKFVAGLPAFHRISPKQRGILGEIASRVLGRDA